MEQKLLQITNSGIEVLKCKIAKLETEVLKYDKSLQRAIECFGISDEQYIDRLQRKLYAENELDLHLEMLKNAQVVQEDEGEHNFVEMGSVVKLVNHKVCYCVEIVSLIEADPIKSKITAESPIGSSIFGKKLGETVEVQMPRGAIEFTIQSIE